MRVLDYDGKIVTTSGQDHFKAETVIWAAGVKGEMINGLHAECVIERAARIKVNEYNQVLSHPNIYAIGDVACMASEEKPYGHPMMAQPAIQQGRLVAKNILAKCGWSPFEGYTFKSRITHTIVNGQLVYASFKVKNIRAGKRMLFDR